MDTIQPEHGRLIAGRARTLLERIEEPEAMAGSKNDETVSELLEDWREQFPDEATFERRLDQLGVSQQTCREAIATDRLAADEPLPEWIALLDAIVTAVQGEFAAPDLVAAIEEASDGTPLFGLLSARIAAYGWQTLPEHVTDVVPETALTTMASWFQRRFQSQFKRILYVEFKSFVAARDEELARADSSEVRDPSSDYYEQFRDYLLDHGFYELCCEYPMFARQVAGQLRQWREHLSEFASRLASDRSALADRFGAEGRIVELEPLADDTHGDGRAVMRLTFESGTSVVYKPRSVEIGAKFYRLLSDLDDHLPTPDHYVPTYLVRDGYGWMGWIDDEPCPNEEAVRRYYRRAGSLACLAYLLEFVDCQFENLLATGEHPVLVDAETLLHPYVGIGSRPAHAGVSPLVQDSVLLTGLFPFDVAEEQESNLSTALAGFGTSSENVELDGITESRFENVTTDVLSVEEFPVEMERGQNVPTIDGKDRLPGQYVDDLVGGFRRTYESILDLRDSGRLSELGVPDALFGLDNRVLYRSTVEYGRILRSVSDRDCLQSGVRFGIEVDELAVPLCRKAISDERSWELYDAERRAIRRLDPPRFESRTDGTAFELGDHRVEAVADESGSRRVRERIESADPADLDRQVALIRRCFEKPSRPDYPETNAVRRSVSDDTLRTEARQLFERVQTLATESEGEYHWTSPAPSNDELRLRPETETLYTGRCGIGLLAGSLFAVTGDDRYRRVATETVRPIRDSIRGERRHDPWLDELGGTNGIGSVAYGLAVLGEFLDDDELLADAARAGRLVTEELIAADDAYDVVSGAAGTILGLLGVHDRRNSPELLSLAVECGDHLLAERTTFEEYRVWDTIDETRPLTGFSHGVAGIAYALVRLWDATGDDRYRDAAMEAIEYERQCYDPDRGNWPYYRPGNQPPEFVDQWCHGRTGVGLGRLGMQRYVDSDRVATGIDRALDGIEGTGLAPLDHLCCGNAGRAEFLLKAARHWDQPTEGARELLGGVVARESETGYYRVSSGIETWTDPTLFHGLAGIGYTMLRVTDTDSLPCLLLWE
ncbi:type 2 lanthipeptide synthetase LanM family protein [Halorussus pelagicus]|uniref:type 2 lanthipeptide synthetase LanM family protein n=1 Tax=Halorussus pelagicus TaxID=2505977 RepID=UPI000FFC8EA2|nr:type 2 lanthipeptide synthetase LanM family protein [Halorussus pelagicus]